MTVKKSRNQTLLEVKNLSVGFPTGKGGVNWVVKNVFLRIQRGETLALVGESGGGKTMTGLAIMQLLPVSARVSKESQIFLDQQDLLQFSELQMQKVRGARIGMIFQEALVALNPVLTIGQQISEVLRRHSSLTRKERSEKTLSLLKEVGIVDPKHCAVSYAFQLSGGMRQRAMIAMALAGKPDLLIADEPTTALDVTIQAQVLTILKKLQEKYQMSLLFITHDLGIVAQMANHVAVINKGEIVEQATVKNFFANPEHTYSQQLFAALPSLENRQRPLDPPANENVLLDVKNLKVYFPIRRGFFKHIVGYVKAVNDVSFALYSGRTLALVGESGSGKTTIGKSILQLVPVTAGKIHFQSIDLTKLSTAQWYPLRGELQIVFQDPYSSMDPRMLVGDIIVEGLVAQARGTEKERESKVIEMLKLVGLNPEARWRYPHEFSGGQRQRICIARSLALEPKILICDEPTSALDVTVQMQILQLLQSIQEKLGLSYLLITHNFSVVAYLADDVAVMQRGKIVEQGSVMKVLQHPKTMYTKKLLASIPKIPHRLLDVQSYE